MVVYPGADGESHWYDDDGKSFAYRGGESMSVVMSWRDTSRRLSLRLATASKAIGLPRRILFRVAGSAKTTEAHFTGRELSVAL
jgi:hypothetical protein